MVPVKFDPMRGFENISRKMNSFMNEFEKGFSFEFGSFSPRIDIAEDEKNIFIHAEVPGIAKEDIKVTINDDNVLTIKGHKKRESKSDDTNSKSFIRVERSFGEFQRSFMLPENVNKDSINAKFENGVLDIVLDKAEPEKPKEIEVTIN